MAYYQPGMRWTAERANRWAAERVWQAEDLDLTNQITPVDTDIQIPVEAGGEYEYRLLISYSAHPGGNNALAAHWQPPQGVSIHRYTLSYPYSGPTSLNAGGEVILRRPAAATLQIIGGGTDAQNTRNYSARDEGVIEANSDGVLIWRVQQSQSGADTPTILYGGPAHTQAIWRRIN